MKDLLSLVIEMVDNFKFVGDSDETIIEAITDVINGNTLRYPERYHGVEDIRSHLIGLLPIAGATEKQENARDILLKVDLSIRGMTTTSTPPTHADD